MGQSETSIKNITEELKLNPTQIEALTTEANEIMYGGSKGGGKLLDLETPILTVDGWKTMGTVHPGDYVFGDDGKPTLVVEESEIDYDEDTYEIIFEDGSKIIAGARHQWVTQTNRERMLQVDSIGEIRTTEEIYLTQSTEDGDINHSIRSRKPLVCPNKDLEFLVESLVMTY